MKKLIFLLLSIAAGFIAFGQTNYYTGQTQITGKNVVYTCKDHGDLIELTNVKKTFIGQAQKMIDGTPADLAPAMDYRGINDPNHTLLYRAFLETFTPEQIADMKQQKADLIIYFYADSGGIIKDLSFYVKKTPTSLSIPPDQWFALEQKLKQYLTARQDICKNYQFAMFFTGFEFDEL